MHGRAERELAAMAKRPGSSPSGKARTLAGKSFKRGERGYVDLPVGKAINNAEISLRVFVQRGTRPGPTLCVSAAIHGDEINGVEIARRLINTRALSRLRGDLLVLPVANAPGFLARSRYLPDRRDLNRLFPGTKSGSLGSRLAMVISTQILPSVTHVIDLHTGAINRANLPQVRVTSGAAEDLELARVFGAPVIIESSVRPGSLRATLRRRKKPVLVFEGGEALRLDPSSIRFGLRGVLSVMRHLSMLPGEKEGAARNKRRVVLSSSTYWERAPSGGLFTPSVKLGTATEVGALLGRVSGPFGTLTTDIRAAAAGIVIGRTNHALVDEGDAVFHVAATKNLEQAERFIRQNREDLVGEVD